MCEDGTWVGGAVDAQPFTSGGPGPTEFGKDGIDDESFTVAAKDDRVTYRLAFRSELDNVGEVVQRGFVKRLMFSRPEIFQAIDWERDFRKLPPLSAQAKEHMFRYFVRFIVLRRTRDRPEPAVANVTITIS